MTPRAFDQAVDFVGREAKLGLANLEAAAVGPQPMECKGRVAPAAGHDTRAGRQTFHEPRDQRSSVAGDVHVVEHENGRLVLQPSQQRVDHGHEIGIGLAEELNDIQPTVALRRPQRGADVSPEHDRVTVEFLAADPRRSGTPLTHPCGQHDALARARRRHDGSQRPIGARAQDVEQPLDERHERVEAAELSTVRAPSRPRDRPARSPDPSSGIVAPLARTPASRS